MAHISLGDGGAATWYIYPHFFCLAPSGTKDTQTWTAVQAVYSYAQIVQLTVNRYTIIWSESCCMYNADDDVLENILHDCIDCT